MEKEGRGKEAWFLYVLRRYCAWPWYLIGYQWSQEYSLTHQSRNLGMAMLEERFGVWDGG